MNDLNVVAQDLRDWWHKTGSSILHDTGSLENDYVKDYVGEVCNDQLESFKLLSFEDQEKALDLAFPANDVIWTS
jgi:hypothetical protein